jgi:hypothetical protein
VQADEILLERHGKYNMFVNDQVFASWSLHKTAAAAGNGDLTIRVFTFRPEYLTVMNRHCSLSTELGDM